GGTRSPNDALVGPLAVEMLRQLRFDQMFLGVHAISPDAGVTTPSLLEGETDRAFIASASEVVVIADHSKWRSLGLTTVIALEDVDVLVSDDQLPPPEAEAARALVGRLVLAALPNRD